MSAAATVPGNPTPAHAAPRCGRRVRARPGAGAPGSTVAPTRGKNPAGCPTAAHGAEQPHYPTRRRRWLRNRSTTPTPRRIRGPPTGGAGACCTPRCSRSTPGTSCSLFAPAGRSRRWTRIGRARRPAIASRCVDGGDARHTTSGSRPARPASRRRPGQRPGATAPSRSPGARDGLDVLARLAAEAGAEPSRPTRSPSRPRAAGGTCTSAPRPRSSCATPPARLGWQIDTRGRGVVAAVGVSRRARVLVEALPATGRWAGSSPACVSFPRAADAARATLGGPW